MTPGAHRLRLADIAALSELRLTVFVGDDLLDRPVGAPIVVESPSTAGQLVGGEPVLTTGIQLGDDPAAWASFFDALTSAGASCLVLAIGAGAAFDDPPAMLAQLARAHELPVLLAPATVAFGTIARAIAERNTEAERAIVQRSFELQLELTAIVARGGGIDELLTGWQRRSGEAATAFDRVGRVLGTSGSFTPAELERLTGELHEHAPRLGEQLLLTDEAAGATGTTAGTLEITPFAGSETVRGYLTRRRSGEEAADLAAPALRALLALEFERRWFQDEPARRSQAERFTRLLQLSDEGRARTLLRGLGIESAELRGIAIETRSETHAEVLVDDLAVVLATPLLRQRGRLVECLTTSRDPRRALQDYGVDTPIGIGTAVAPAHAALTMRQAALALETSRRAGGPIEYVDGAAHEFLIRVAPTEYLDAFADATLAAIEHASGSDALLLTLHTWLVERRSVEATAERLGVHRHTVRNRMQRISQLTGHNLDSIDAQTELWLALKARGFRNDEHLLAAEANTTD